jgi:hypothetical protein
VARNHLVLFGDPGSNPLIEKVLGGLPIKWTKDTITIGDQSWSAKDHGVCLIFPNPMNRSKYVVLNSGHTFHAKEFQSTNANLFPRLGDIAVQKITDGASGKAEEVPVWSGIFNSRWQF